MTSPEDEAFALAWLAERRPAGEPARRRAGRGDWGEWAWLPERCANGHVLVVGRVNGSYGCSSTCAVTTDDRGHYSYSCGYPECFDGPWHPPGCIRR